MVADMPALPSVNKVLACRMIGTDANDNEVGTHFDVSYTGSAPSTAECNTFAAAIGAAWETALVGLASNDFTLTTIKVADLTSPTAFYGEATVSHAGTRGAGELPLSTCFTLEYQVVLRRRGGHFHGQHRWGITSDLQSAQTWTSGFVTAALAAWTSFIGIVTAAGWSGAGSLAQVGIGYYGPPNRTITGSTGRVRTVSTLLATPEQYPVIGYAANTRLGSQRRRLGKSGT